jgi:anti-sigma B factor antagonist
MVRPADFEIAQRSEGTALFVSMSGELDMRTSSLVTTYLADNFGAGLTDLTLDLRDLSFMDSSGVRLLIELHHRSQAEAWELKLLAPKHEAAALVLRVTGADTALPFQEDGAL